MDSVVFNSKVPQLKFVQPVGTHSVCWRLSATKNLIFIKFLLKKYKVLVILYLLKHTHIQTWAKTLLPFHLGHWATKILKNAFQVARFTTWYVAINLLKWWDGLQRAALHHHQSFTNASGREATLSAHPSDTMSTHVFNSAGIHLQRSRIVLPCFVYV